MSKSSRRSSIGSESSFTSADDVAMDGTGSDYRESISGREEGGNTPAIPVTKSHAAFVSKLYNMVEDPEIQDLISWSETGDLFRVYNPTIFSRNVLPQYFKHNNWQSFVRQLNMYGFNKVNDMIHSNLKNENQTWEFRHPHFRQGAIDDLRNIKRKSVRSLRATAPLPSTSPADSDGRTDLYFREYSLIEDRIRHITAGYNTLTEEFTSLRVIVSRQQEVIKDMISVLDIMGSSENSTALSVGSTSDTSNKYASLHKKVDALQAQLNAFDCHCIADLPYTHDTVKTDTAPARDELPPIDTNDCAPSVLLPITSIPPTVLTAEPASIAALPVNDSINIGALDQGGKSLAYSNSVGHKGLIESSNAARSKSAIMGLGKESYLLNPAEDEDECQDIKRRRSGPT